MYNSIIEAGTFKASSISVAEAAKVIENTQRDVNIALINELALIFNKLSLDTHEVLEAAATKWNFLHFKPGLVGGHCIGVDPYYLTHKAVKAGFHPEIILSGRKINDNMGAYIAKKTIEELTKSGLSPNQSQITILGLTFKENCPDLRNTKVISIIQYLKQFGCNVTVSDVYSDPDDAKRIYNIHLKNLDQIKNQDAIIIAVGHEQYKKISITDWKKMLIDGGVIMDIKSIYDRSVFVKSNIKHWRL